MNDFFLCEVMATGKKLYAAPHHRVDTARIGDGVRLRTLTVCELATGWAV
jgi:hypothetical protein